MCILASFLPPMLNLDGQWEEVLDRLYSVFKKDFIAKPVFCQNLKVIYDNHKIYDDKEEIFWHLISKNDKSRERIPDYNRAKRLPWVNPILKHYSDPSIKTWNYLESNGKVRVYLWLEHYDYVVVLEKNKGGRKHLVVLITAFYVEDWKRKDLERRYQKRIIEEDL